MPRRKNPTQFTFGRSIPIASLGDSITYNTSFVTMPHEFHPEVFAGLMRLLGYPVFARNFGQSGDTTTGMLARVDELFRFETPMLVNLFGGINDAGNGITGATTQSNIEAIGAYVLADDRAQYLAIGNTQYLNYTSGGDSLDTPYAPYAALRPYQEAAYDTLAAAYPGRVAWVDVYDSMRGKIVDGTETEHSASWHVANTDQHLNPLGERYVADAFFAVIQAQAAWLQAMINRSGWLLNVGAPA